MKEIIGVKFKREGKIYSFDATGLTLQKNAPVIVETEHGLVLGFVATDLKTLNEESPQPLKKILRQATEDDLRVQDENKALEKTAKSFCIEKARLRNLPMKVIEAEYLFDRSKVVFYFTAENRVDFRELVKDLVQRFKIRIELKQIGSRQEARLLKGIGICGREVCCTNMLYNLDRVSVKMAKEQGMSLNPEKISGLCGRLMCCLSYEYDGYCEIKKNMPKCGKTIQLEEGRAKVIRQNVLREEIAVEFENGKEMTLHIKDIPSGNPPAQPPPKGGKA
ncbi:MAG: stage 0 sporulation family protein [Syntrophales bacterium]|nr:stage 0 sporulation family protein [Syntrophales bacterium]